MNRTRIFAILATCAVVAAVVVAGLFTVGTGGAIALGAGVVAAAVSTDRGGCRRVHRSGALTSRRRSDPAQQRGTGEPGSR